MSLYKNRTIFVTGAGGILGNALIEGLLKEGQFKIMAYSRDHLSLSNRFYHDNQIDCYDNADFQNNIIPFNGVDMIIHCAFTKNNDGFSIAESLNFTKKMLNLTSIYKIPSFINISSRSVYGQNPETPWTEKTIVNPNSLYALGKYSSELLTNIISLKTGLHVTNIRLAGLNAPLLDERITSKFVKMAINRKPIKIVGGKQSFSFLDIRDAVNAIISFIKNTTSKSWHTVYNLGPNHVHTVIELAEIVKEVAKEYLNYKVKIEIERSDLKLYAKMDSNLFYKDADWRPQYDMQAIVSSIFNHQLNTN